MPVPSRVLGAGNDATKVALSLGWHSTCCPGCAFVRAAHTNPDCLSVLPVSSHFVSLLTAVFLLLSRLRLRVVSPARLSLGGGRADPGGTSPGCGKAAWPNTGQKDSGWPGLRPAVAVDEVEAAAE